MINLELNDDKMMIKQFLLDFRHKNIFMMMKRRFSNRRDAMFHLWAVITNVFFKYKPVYGLYKSFQIPKEKITYRTIQKKIILMIFC